MSPEDGRFETSNAAVAADLMSTRRTLCLRDRSLLVRWSNVLLGEISKAAPNATTAVPSFRIVANELCVCWNTSLRGNRPRLCWFGVVCGLTRYPSSEPMLWSKIRLCLHTHLNVPSHRTSSNDGDGMNL